MGDSKCKRSKTNRKNSEHTKPIVNIIGPIRERLRRNKGKPECRKSDTNTIRSNQLELCNGRGEPICAGSNENNRGPGHDSPKAKNVSSSWIGDLDNSKGPSVMLSSIRIGNSKRAVEKTNAVGSGHPDDCIGNKKPRCRKSRTESKKPSSEQARVDGIEPDLTLSRTNGILPGHAQSKTEGGNPEQAMPKTSNVKPKAAKLWSNRNKSKLLEPNAKVEESKDESPNNNTKRPGCDKLRRDIKNSGDVESKANIAEPTSPSE